LKFHIRTIKTRNEVSTLFLTPTYDKDKSTDKSSAARIF